MRLATWFFAAVTLVACAPQVSTPAKSPEPTPPPAHSEWKQVEPAKQKLPLVPELVPEPVGLPAADSSCDAFGKHSTEGCGTVSSGRDALAAALDGGTALDRDRRLT